MNFVDEQHRPLLDIGEIRQQVLGGGECGAAGDLHVHAHIARDAGGEGRLAQARRAVEKDMSQRLAPLGGRIDGDAQPLVDFALPDHVAHALRAKIAIFVFGSDGRLENRFAGHGGKYSGLAAGVSRCWVVSSAATTHPRRKVCGS